MTALVTVETVLLVLLSVLVVGLLRSHAEILRRLADPAERPSAPPAGDVLAPGLAGPRPDAPDATDVAGATPWDDAVQIGVSTPGTRTLLAFLTSGCSVCAGFWRALAAGAGESLPGGVRVVVVARDASHESSARLRELASPGLQVVMSTDAWSAYRVPVAPYFVLVDGARGVEGEGAARSWDQVRSLLADAIADVEAAERDDPDVGDRVERELAAAGIGADHPSLYGPVEDRREAEAAS
jgi:hypothetical protein